MSEKQTDASQEGAAHEKAIGELIDELQLKRLEKADAKKALTERGKEFTAIEETIITFMESLKLEKAAGKTATVTYSIKVMPSVTDVEEFIKWVVETGSYEFVQKRINSAPVLAMLELENYLPPGTDTYNKPTLGLTKRTKAKFK